MRDKLVKAVKELAKKAIEANSGLEAQQYAQATLNVANALMTVNNSKF